MGKAENFMAVVKCTSDYVATPAPKKAACCKYSQKDMSKDEVQPTDFTKMSDERVVDILLNVRDEYCLSKCCFPECTKGLESAPCGRCEIETAFLLASSKIYPQIPN